MIRRPRFRLTIGGLLILIALIALGIAWMKPAVTQIADLKVGTGPPVKKGDKVSLHYVGTLKDGTEFDSSKARGVPFDLPVGGGMVIQGWEVGLIGMQTGGVRRLTIPPEEAYGARGIPGTIPPDATLIFEIELIAIQ